MQLVPYLKFNGQTEEALAFYARALDGKIERLVRWSDAPVEAPAGADNLVMHSELSFGDNMIMVSDACEGSCASQENVTLTLQLQNDTARAERVFQALSAGGQVLMPLEKTFWGALYGYCKDQYGVGWMVNCMLEAPK